METTRTDLQCEGYEGVDVMLGKFTYVAPPLTLRSLRALLPKIAALGASTVPSSDDFDTIVEVVHTTLKRNYPGLTAETVEDGLDMKNINVVMGAILAASGLEAGNAKAATAPAPQ
jgi:hypothetical protein